MGVPRFFSWITRRYPLSMQDLQQDPVPQIDCLYLDMNGIIYRCSKDDSIIFRDQVMSRKAEQIWFSIFNYINSIVEMAKPKKLLFLGLDGVAPRAKMNNQRSRRFKSAKDYRELERKLEYLGDVKNEEEFQNNCITPGTEFMAELNKQLRFFIAKKIQEDVKWRQFAVMFSGADVPGEGEHKIMDFIRKSNELGVFDEDTTHCLYGADADLIMLGMSLKVKKMCIIRQEFTMKSDKTIISQTRCIKQIKFKIIYINILKEYFDLEYKPLATEMKIPYDRQRAINDFVFLCFFIGNDFLPRCYCYDIREGNLEMLIYGFKKFLKQCEDYIIQEESINLKELHRLTSILSEFEGEFVGSRSEESQLAYQTIKDNKDNGNKGENEGELEEFEQELKDKLVNSLEKMKSEQQFLLRMKTLYLNDKVAAKAAYYQAKLSINPATEPQKVTKLIEDYIQGLDYVYHYYFSGLPSWEWYFPHYYAPLVADLSAYLGFMITNGITMKPFNKSLPYEPFKQLMCILPKDSVVLLPKCLQNLILDESSQLRRPFDYYPDKIEIDPYGGLREHEFVNILPFIDQQKMTSVYNSIPQTSYTEAQRSRNKFSLNELYRYSPTNKILIQSSYSQISNFSAPIVIQYVDFATNDVMKLKDQSRPGEKSLNEAGEYTFPTLYMRNFEAVFVYIAKKERRMELIIPNSEADKEDYRLGSEVYFGYPYEEFGRVIAISTPESIKNTQEFDAFDFITDPNVSNKHLQSEEDYWRESVKLARRRGLQINPEKAYWLKQPIVTVRKFNGEYARSYCVTHNSIQPSPLVSSKPRYSYTHTLFKPKSIQQEFSIGETVVVLATRWAGSKGVVTGYDSENKAVRVKITDPISQIPEDILRAVNTNEYFFSIKFVAQLMETDVRVLLDILDSVQVLMDASQPISLAFSKTLDLGLNLIKRNEKKIVPNMVRFRNQGAETNNLFRLFFDAEISVDAVNLLYEYRDQHPEFFAFMTNRMKKLEIEAKKIGENVNFKEVIHAGDIYPEEKDPNKPVTKTYLWLLKQQEIYYHNASINSKKVSKQKIGKLLDYFRTMKSQALPKNDFFFDPNYLHSQRLTQKGLYYLSKQPQFHAIQDRVICLNQAYFGERAVVIGISDKEYEVLFERPSFGKNDLGGIVDFLWGGKFDFQELFDINTCSGLILPRFKSDPKNVKRFWDGSVPEFVARYTGSAITNMREFQIVNRHMNCPFALAEKLAKQSAGEADDGFQVVAPKRSRNYYPSEKERKVISGVQQTNDPMKIVKDFARDKNLLVETAIDKQPLEIQDEKKPTNFEDFEEATGHGQKQPTSRPQVQQQKPREEVKKVQQKKPEPPKKKEFVKYFAAEQDTKKQSKPTQKQMPKKSEQLNKQKPKPKYVPKQEPTVTQTLQKEQPKPVIPPVQSIPQTKIQEVAKPEIKPEVKPEQSQTIPLPKEQKQVPKVEPRPATKLQEVKSEPVPEPKQEKKVETIVTKTVQAKQQETPKEEYDDQIFG